MRQVGVAGTALAAVCAAPPANAADFATTVPARCAAVAGSGIPSISGRQLAVRVQGALPDRLVPGVPFTLDKMSATFTVDPAMMRPQFVRVDGTLTARLDSMTFAATGTTPIVAAVPGLPLPLGSIPRRVDIAPRFVAPPGAPERTFAPIGPWAATGATSSVAVALGNFSLTLAFSRPDRPTFAPITTTLSCRSGATVARVPVLRFQPAPRRAPEPVLALPR